MVLAPGLHHDVVMSPASRRLRWVIVDWVFDDPSRLEAAQARLDAIIQTARSLAPDRRIVYVFLEQDRPWWRRHVDPETTESTLLEVPFDRGSAIAVWLAAHVIQRWCPNAWVEVLGREPYSVSLERLLNHFHVQGPAALGLSAPRIAEAAAGRTSLDEVYPFMDYLNLSEVLRAVRAGRMMLAGA